MNTNGTPVPEPGPDYSAQVPPPDVDETLNRTKHFNAHDSQDLHKVVAQSEKIVDEFEDRAVGLVRDERQLIGDLALARAHTQRTTTCLERTERGFQARRDALEDIDNPPERNERRFMRWLPVGAGLAEALLFLIGWDALVPTGEGLLNDIRDPVIGLGTLGVSFACAVATYHAGRLIAEIDQRNHLAAAPVAPTTPTTHEEK